MGDHFTVLASRSALGAAAVSDDLAAAATAYTDLGLPVFPVHAVDPSERCTCGTDCGRNAGKHPRTPNGLLDASLDPNRIRDWWSRWPDANVAVATGATAGIWVLDVDPVNGGLESLETLEAGNGELHPTWCVETGGGGFHLWFLLQGVGLRNSVGHLGPGLDVRAEGGYVLVPPSRHRSGNRYVWAPAWHPTLVDLGPAPTWLLDLLRRPAPPKLVPPDRSARGNEVGGNHYSSSAAAIAEGARNATLTSLAGVMRRKGCGERAIVSALLVENIERCVPPLPESEIATIARSVCRYAPTMEPRLGRSSQRSRAFVEYIDGKAVAR
ncbi:MAG: bifunctional DNA primase/polymerase [Chloroflexota bacterium]|nr:bifunctional DNA primase/polymerase [Chloroflexota bacterium]